MKNAPKLFFILFVLLIQIGVVFAQDEALPPPPGEPGGGPGGPPGSECCIDFEYDLAAYNECLSDPESYCNAPLPADNSIHILMCVGLAFGTFVIFKKINHKKTPM